MHEQRNEPLAVTERTYTVSFSGTMTIRFDVEGDPETYANYTDDDFVEAATENARDELGRLLSDDFLLDGDWDIVDVEEG
jgi:hypothetical protein